MQFFLFVCSLALHGSVLICASSFTFSTLGQFVNNMGASAIEFCDQFFCALTSREIFNESRGEYS